MLPVRKDILNFKNKNPTELLTYSHAKIFIYPFHIIIADGGRWFIAMYSKESKIITSDTFDLSSVRSNIDQSHSKGKLIDYRYMIHPSYKYY